MSKTDQLCEDMPDVARDAMQGTARDSLRPDSPCAGYCSTSHGDEVCKGCGRTFDEVLNWIMYDDAEKEAVWTRLEAAGLVRRS